MEKENKKTLILEASKAIANLGVRVESEKVWGDFDCLGYYVYDKESIDELFPHVYTEEDFETIVPAPSLSELFSALPEIGKVLGWYPKSEEVLDGDFEVCKIHGDEALEYADIEDGGYHYCEYCNIESEENGTIFVDKETYHAHSLLDLYLSGGMEAVSAEIIRLIAIDSHRQETPTKTKEMPLFKITRDALDNLTNP